MDFNTESRKENVYVSKPGAYKFDIENYVVSEDVPNHRGCPFVRFYCITPSGEKASVKFFRTRETDSDRAKEVKKERIAKFIRNSGGKLSNNMKDVFDSVVGRSVYMFMTEREYVAKDSNNNNKPVVRTTIDYLFSSDKEITRVKPDMAKQSLNARDQQYFDTLYSHWSQTNKDDKIQMVKDAFDAVEDFPTESNDNELPF